MNDECGQEVRKRSPNGPSLTYVGSNPERGRVSYYAVASEIGRIRRKKYSYPCHAICEANAELSARYRRIKKKRRTRRKEKKEFFLEED